MYLRLTDIDFDIKNQIEARPGVYKLIVVDDSNIPISLNRFLGPDPNGILYIGKSENFRVRLTNMRRAFLPKYKSNKHIAVRRYNELSNIAKFYPIQNIVVFIVPTTDNEPIAKSLETKILKDYEFTYGERPPLNKQ